MAKLHTFKLNTGALIPSVGMGCWRGQPGLGPDKELMRSLKLAIQAGYRHLDTASMYQNEADIGQIIKESGVARSDFFLTTKLGLSMHDNVEKAIDESLDKLDTPYVDLYLMHWPQGRDSNGDAYGDGTGKGKGPTFQETWAAMEEKCFKTGKAKAIGVSNFSVQNLEKLLQTAKVVPAVNQVECHRTCPNWSWRPTAGRRAFTSQTTRLLGPRTCLSMPTRTLSPSRLRKTSRPAKLR
ncbi:hypothetical protein L7F22_033025 [Adiantum nelumboides]|nr:hypothetical protein [Adiantum nelumboides]